jgi:hypothetical protein
MGATNRLTALQIKNVAAGKYANGSGLWLHRWAVVWQCKSQSKSANARSVR